MSDAVITDLYEATMALSYLREGLTGPATFSLFVRDLPPQRGFLVAAGLRTVTEFLEEFQITGEDVVTLAAALDRPVREVEPLRGLRFDGEVWAVPEGEIVLAAEPLLEITAALPVAQLVESYVLNQVSHQTTLASKAARSVIAARGRPVIDFSLRRDHGVEAAMHAARSGSLVGFAATSNVAAARAYGVRATGTMAHSYIEVFLDEMTAFRAFAACHPGPVTLLVDTYDTENGVRYAAEAFKELGLGPGCAVRLDSGDLDLLSRRSREILDRAGLRDVRIVASGGLDEYGIDELVEASVPVDVFAVGTKVGTAADAPYLDSAYKLVAHGDRPVMKLSPGKLTAPGAKQVFRGPAYDDIVALRTEPCPDRWRPLLRQVMVDGRRVRPSDTLEDGRRTFTTALALLPEYSRRVHDPLPPRVRSSAALAELTSQLARTIVKRTCRADSGGGAA